MKRCNHCSEVKAIEDFNNDRSQTDGKSPRCKECQRYYNSLTNPRRTPTYHSWYGMIQRCTNPNQSGFHYYGDKGVTVCEEWKESYSNFIRDMGMRPKGRTLDRINPFKDYTKDNCRWSTWKEQRANRRDNYDN